jgi:putative membrane protein
MRALGIVAVVLVGLVVLSLFGGFGHAGYGMGPRFAGGYWDGPWGWGPGFLLLGGLFKILFIVGLFLIIGSLFRHRGPRWYGPSWMGAHGSSESPLEILKRRLAKGEISREDYESLKTELS